MVRTFQLTKALSRLSVIENMRLGAQSQSGEGFVRPLFPAPWRRKEQEITERADELLERFKLTRMRDAFAASCPAASASC
jgi:branched-chain amino acid transport system ATP-binding protein